jgi:chromosome partitioning protein
MIVAFANQKGGVAKTTSAVNVAHGLAAKGHSTLLVDADPQANATYAVLGDEEPPRTIYDLLINDQPLARCTIPTKTANLHLLPSSIDLAGAEVELLSETGGQTLLRTKLRKAGYDYIVIDAPPSLGLLCINCLAAATDVLIPVAVGVFALKGLAQLEATVEKVRSRLDRPDLAIGGVFATMTDNTKVSRDVVEAIRQRYGAVAFATSIPRSVRTEEAHSRSLSVLEYAPGSAGAIAYQQLVEEIISRG